MAACSAAAPGEGRVKDVLPDAHADFVYAVAGEEFGMIVCLVIARACSRSSCCAACCGCCRSTTCSSCSPSARAW